MRPPRRPSSRRCASSALRYRLQLEVIDVRAQALQQNNTEGARIYAANAIRKKNEALNLLRLSSRCVPSRSSQLLVLETRQYRRGVKSG
jgi:hypothetical protein